MKILKPVTDLFTQTSPARAASYVAITGALIATAAAVFFAYLTLYGPSASPSLILALVGALIVASLAMPWTLAAQSLGYKYSSSELGVIVIAMGLAINGSLVGAMWAWVESRAPPQGRNDI